MNITFGAQLITKPENFYLKTDTASDKEHIDRVFDGINKFLQLPQIQKHTQDDTVELVRGKSAKKFRYEILYKFKNQLGQTETDNIKMNINGAPKEFHLFDFMFQFANIIYHKTGRKPHRFGTIQHMHDAFGSISREMIELLTNSSKNVF